MFHRQPKEHQNSPNKVKGDQSRQRSSFNRQLNVSEAPDTKTSTENHPGRTPWWSRLFARSQTKDKSLPKTLTESCNKQQRLSTSDGPSTTTAPPPKENNQQGKKKKKSCWRLFSCCRRKSRVTPRVEDKDLQKSQQPDSSIQADRVEEFKGLNDEETHKLEVVKEEDEKAAAAVPQQTDYASLLEDAVIKVLCQRQTKQGPSSKRPVKREAGTQQHNSFCQGDKVTAHKEHNKEEKSKLKGDKDEDKKSAATVPLQTDSATCNKEKVTRVVCQKPTTVRPQSLRVQQISQLGFPNPLFNCYMNSSLQSLITLAEFIRDINHQEDTWSLIQEAELISRFMSIVRCHGSKDGQHKLRALKLFKRTVSVQAPEFSDNRQKDAHEFITTILGQMRTLAPQLQEVATFVGRSYTCPVENNLLFKMQNTRTCKRCGTQSIREEEFINLSLDLLPRGSVQQMIQSYQEETELEYTCECGGKASGQCFTFLTLPKVLMLHIKRFTFTPSYQLVKRHEPVNLFRELMVTSRQAEGWYSLVSVISHLGSGGNSGHYVSDGLHPDQDLDGAGDRWLQFNDAMVTETTGDAVCEQRQKTAYILFYQRRF